MNAPGPGAEPTAEAVARRRRRGRLNRRDVIDAVIEVGFDNATLATVAKHLAVNHATLYGHIESRDDMVLAAAELVFDAAPWPEVIDGAASESDTVAWVETLRRSGLHLWSVFSAHPGLAIVVGAAPIPPSAVTEHYAVLATHLRTSGLSAEDSLAAAEMLFHHAAESAARESSVADVDESQWEQWEQVWVAPLSDELQAAMSQRFASHPDERFAASLDVLLAGMQVRFSPGRTAR